jgi:hypothetical protein
MKPLSISDHALLRWLERVHGIDIDFFRAQLAEEVKGIGGADCLKTEHFVYCAKEGVLTTVLTRELFNEMRAKQLAAKRWKGKGRG